MRRSAASHAGAVCACAALAVLWTWPLARHFSDHIPGAPGDNFSFVWNLWWMRKALADPALEFFHSPYLFYPFGVDLINHPHTALQAYVSATLLGRLTEIEAENLYIIVSVGVNALAAYALAYDLARRRLPAFVAAVAFGGSPYVAAHLLGHFDLLTAWTIPLFALFFRRALRSGSIWSAAAAGAAVALAAYTAYYHVVYQAIFAITYAWAALRLSRVERSARTTTWGIRAVRLAAGILIAFDLALMAIIAATGGTSFQVGGLEVSLRGLQNPLLVLWLLGAVWLLTRHRLTFGFTAPSKETFWKAAQSFAVVAAVFAVLALPLVIQAFRLAASGRYVSQTYFWRSAPRGVDVVAPALGNPFHPLTGDAASGLYGRLGLDRIDAVAWLGVIPMLLLLAARGRWADAEEARRWKAVMAVFAVWALGPFLTAAGQDLGLPLPQALARFIPLVDNARMPGRAMAGVYLALSVLLALRAVHLRPAMQAAAAGLLVIDYLAVPVPLTTLTRPRVYEHLASIEDEGPVVEVPFGIGDGLSAGRGSQERRLLYHATIHGHPVLGGYIGRMPPGVAQVYDQTPVIGNLLRLSSGEDAVEESIPARVPFRYLVLDTAAAPVNLIEYVRATLDMDLLVRDGVLELYAVQGTKGGAAQVRQVRQVQHVQQVKQGRQVQQGR